MEKFYGTIGFVHTCEEPKDSGIYVEKSVERKYYGENVKRSRRLTGNEVVDSVVITNTISIIADPYAMDHFCDIRYAELFCKKWKVESVDVQFPRLILTLGGLYNGGNDKCR